MSVIQPSVNINGHEYDYLAMLGYGKFGKVYLGKQHSSNNMYAIKIIKKDKIQDPEKAIRHLAKLKLLDHENVLKLYDYTTTSENLYLLMEYASFGKLFDYLKNGIDISERKAQYLFHQIVGAVHYLHGNNCAHGDLKPSNILVDINGNIKLADCGIFEIAKADYVIDNTYCAPEIRSHGFALCDGFKADCYSLGIIFRDIVHKSEIRMTQECNKLFAELTAEKPSDRISTGALLKNGWFD